ncbi:MAG: class I SAM-dependent DNA methyltransferase [Stellaceae bacterium]
MDNCVDGCDQNPTEATVEAFIGRWQRSAASERSNYQMFLFELCDLLGLPRPEPATGEPGHDDYVFERPVHFHNFDGTTSIKFIDLYRHNCFVLETKQGCEAKQGRTLLEETGLAVPRRRRGHGIRGTETWDAAMLRARGQAEQYAKALPEWPPFLIIADVGHSIETYADFTGTGKHYAQFPDTNSFRIFLPELARDEIRERLRAIWREPLSLDPSRHAARVTREIAARLATLGRSLEKAGHGAERVALFLMRSLFTMFAEDVGLLAKNSFRELLRGLRGRPHTFAPMMRGLWSNMDKGGFSPELGEDILRFNGGLFQNTEAIPLDGEQLELLIDAAEADWSAVEPAIFGTLLERALDERERERLGAHYTPRAYVERLVLPTIIEPLRADWEAVKAAAVELADAGDKAGAIAELRRFHETLCNTTILDPACGTGNFLYVALEHLKRLEGEVLDLLAALGETLTLESLAGHTVDPHQLRGIEANPRAVAITELVLWIGYLQWHFRIRGRAMPAEPVLRNFRNIEHGDALLVWRTEELVRGPDGRPLTRWDGRTKKPHPVTGAMVPDDNARVEVVRLLGAQPARWPRADFIIGNPPFIGGKDLRAVQGEGYAEALWNVYRQMPQSADYVMYWWHRAAQQVAAGHTRRFGLITTNSLPQAFNRRVVKAHLEHVDGISLTFAIPNHPWVEASDAAAVRIAMTVGVKGRDRPGRLLEVTRETPGEDGESDVEFTERNAAIHADLRIGADLTRALPLRANEGLCSPGVKLHGAGFIVTPEEAKALGLGRVPGLDRHIRPYLNGRDLNGHSRKLMVIDLFGLSEVDVRQRFPDVYQWVLERVKPERDQNNERYRRENWWLFGRRNTDLRSATAGLRRFISTAETSRHRFFVFLPEGTRPDNMLVNFGFEDGSFLGVLSSSVHVVWATAVGGHQGVGDDPRYNKTRCFDPFPFPDCGEGERAAIAAIAEELDGLRKERLRLYPDLTLTALYNVLAKLRSGEDLTEAERGIHDRGLVGVIRRLHDDLDRAVFAAYGWPTDISDDDLLARLVALNRERAEEEFRGTIRWLRPEFQAGIAAAPAQRELVVEQAAAAARQSLPRDLPGQFKAVRAVLAAESAPAAAEQVAAHFVRARRDRVAAVLETLVSLGQAREAAPGRYAA